jgi:hypothetical protein
VQSPEFKLQYHEKKKEGRKGRKTCGLVVLLKR